MLIDLLIGQARAHLVTVADSAPLLQAAALLRPGVDLVVVCRADDSISGVVTKSDVVAQISHCQGASCTCAIATVMTRDIFFCRLGDSLPDLWSVMRGRGIKNVPLVDSAMKPMGVVTARDVLQILLKGAENEEMLLRDYVMGFGYR